MGLIDELYDDDNFGECLECGEEHVLCPSCSLCLKYCHPIDYCEGPTPDPFDELQLSESGND